MNQFLLRKEQFISDKKFALEKEFETNYLKTHLKKKLGDIIKVCYLDHGIGTAKILEISDEKIICELISLSSQQRAQWDLLIAWPRPQQAKRIIEFGTSLGVKKFDFFSSELADPNYTYSGLFLDKQYTEFLEKGLIQSKSYYELPKLRTFPYSPLKSYGHYKQKFFLDIDGHSWPSIDFSTPLLLAFGPERGWSNNERCKLLDQSYTPIKIHESTLKEELAIYTALSQLTLLQDKVN